MTNMVPFTDTSGPNSPLANGALVPCFETCIKFAFKALDKIARQGAKSFSPKAVAVDDFQEHKDAVMKDLVWTSGCRSWYKNGSVTGKVWGPWPGSAITFIEFMTEPRWEDWDIEFASNNRFQFLGYGKSEREINGGDLAWYLAEPNASEESHKAPAEVGDLFEPDEEDNKVAVAA
jgi:hypothetical protein